MSQVIDLCEGDDNGEWPNAQAMIMENGRMLLFHFPERNAGRMRNHPMIAHPENGPGQKTAAGWAEFVFDLELAEEEKAGISLHKKRRRIMKSERSVKNDAARKKAQTLKEIHTTDEDVGSEDAQVVDHDESHRGIAAAASHPMNSDPEQTGQDDGSANKHPQSRSTSKGTAWEDRLSELADYRKMHGHCNVPQKNSETPNWVRGSQPRGIITACT
jgi:hypothetical protein